MVSKKRNTNSIYDRNSGNYSKNHDYNLNDRRLNDRDRRAEMDRINRHHDREISRYRNDRSINSYERNRRIHDAEIERQQKANSFGKGLAVGAIAGVILGVLIGR